MPGRSSNSAGARFGYNGQMKDNDIAGVGNHLDFKFRGYDPRTGRFYSVDPLSKQYPWNSSYAFAENDVIRCIDLEGLEKVFVFGGADLLSTGLSQTTISTADDIKKYSDDNKLGFNVYTYNVAPWNLSQYDAFEFLKKNYKQGEPIIVYGYSMGGVAANQFTKLAKLAGINVGLLVTVDAAWGYFGKPIEVSNNVDYIFNFYQTISSPIGSHGYAVERGELNSEKPNLIINSNWTDMVKNKGRDAHSFMDESTQPTVLKIIDSFMSGKIDVIIQKIFNNESIE